MEYIYNSRTGGVTPYSEALLPQRLLLHSGLGWHGPFANMDAVNAYYNANKAKNPGWKAPSINPVTAIQNAPDAAKDQTSAAVKGVGLSDDEIRSWFIRIGEVLLGVVLLGVGVAKLTGTTNIVASAVKAKL